MWPFTIKTDTELDIQIYRVSFKTWYRSEYVRKSVTLEAYGMDDAADLASSPYDHVFDIEVALR